MQSNTFKLNDDILLSQTGSLKPKRVLFAVERFYLLPRSPVLLSLCHCLSLIVLLLNGFCRIRRQRRCYLEIASALSVFSLALSFIINLLFPHKSSNSYRLRFCVKGFAAILAHRRTSQLWVIFLPFTVAMEASTFRCIPQLASISLRSL